MSKGRVNYILKRIFQLVITLVILSMIVFIISRIAPGDPLKAYHGQAVERMSEEQLQHSRERLGLNEPLYKQYVKWAENSLKGDFGISYKYKQPALSVVGDFIGNTIILTSVSFVIIFVLAILLAAYCVKKEGTWIDKVIYKLGVATSSMPEFFVAILLILLFSITFNMLPHSGSDSILNLILPVASIVISHLWYCTYLIRNKLSEEVRKEYVLLYRVKGLSYNKIIFSHCLKNIMPAVVSIMAIFLPHLLGGAYIVEIIFSYPGLGKLGVESAQYMDYNMIMLVCLITGAVVISANMIAQIINDRLDPRMEQGGKK